MRKVIQIAVSAASEDIMALCDDGGLFVLSGGRWERMEPIPQDEAASEAPTPPPQFLPSGISGRLWSVPRDGGEPWRIGVLSSARSIMAGLEAVLVDARTPSEAKELANVWLKAANKADVAHMAVVDTTHFERYGFSFIRDEIPF